MDDGMAAVVGSGLLAAWPVTHTELVTAALPDLDAHAAAVGVRLHTSTWRLIQPAADLPGWEHWPGDLLVATATVTPEGAH